MCFVTGSKNIKFKQETYSVVEDKGQLTVSVERSRSTDECTVALIATHPTKGTAIGMHMMHMHDILICLLCLMIWELLGYISHSTVVLCIQGLLWSIPIAIYKHFVHFHFQFTFNDIKVNNV